MWTFSYSVYCKDANQYNLSEFDSTKRVILEQKIISTSDEFVTVGYLKSKASANY